MASPTSGTLNIFFFLIHNGRRTHPAGLQRKFGCQKKCDTGSVEREYIGGGCHKSAPVLFGHHHPVGRVGDYHACCFRPKICNVAQYRCLRAVETRLRCGHRASARGEKVSEGSSHLVDHRRRRSPSLCARGHHRFDDFFKDQEPAPRCGCRRLKTHFSWGIFLSSKAMISWGIYFSRPTDRGSDQFVSSKNSPFLFFSEKHPS